MSMNAQQVKEWAKLLYTKEMLTQREVAERTGKSPTTINRWVKKDRWDDLRVSLTITKEEQLKSLYTQLKELNDEIAARPERRYATTAESDTISKLSSAIEKMETEVGLSEIISAFKGFTEWLRPINLDDAKLLAAHMDEYIKYRLK